MRTTWHDPEASDPEREPHAVFGVDLRNHGRHEGLKRSQLHGRIFSPTRQQQTKETGSVRAKRERRVRTGKGPGVDVLRLPRRSRGCLCAAAFQTSGRHLLRNTCTNLSVANSVEVPHHGEG